MWLIEKFHKHKDRTAIIFNQKLYTYADLNQKIDWYANYFEDKGVESGCVVLFCSKFSFDAIAILLAFAKRNNIIALAEPNYSTNLDKLVKDSSADYLVFFNNEELEIKSKVSEEKHNLISQIQLKNKPGLILFSSGTTGEPKVMLHDFSQIINSYKNNNVKDINSLILMGFDHIGGVDSILRLLSICATITLTHQLSPSNICKVIEDYKVQVLPATPTFLNLLILSEAYKQFDLTSIRIIGFGAEPMPEVLLNKIREIFPNVSIQQKFGTTETNAIKIYNKPSDELYFKITDDQVDYKIVNNELWLKSKNNILGYLNVKNQPFEEDGWINTGDLVDEREDGFIKILGRKKDVINVGGEKVLPIEVENFLLRNQYVKDCMVYGIPNVITGSAVGAEIVVIKNAPDDIKAQLRKFCKNGLPIYKNPVKYKLVKEIMLSQRQKKVRKYD